MSDDGILAIVLPCAELFDKQSRHRSHLDANYPGLETNEDVLNFIAKKDVPEGKEYFICDKNAIPQDRYFRNAWLHNDGKINIHLDKAKNIHLDKLREIRSQKFIEMGFPQRLHPQVENAILDESTKSKLKELRDFPKNMDLSNISEPDILKNMIPDCLK